MNVTIGIYLQSESARLHATLASLARHAGEATVVLLPDAPEPELAAALAGLHGYPQLAGAVPRGEAAAFNRLASYDASDVIVFLEGGAIVTAGWLPRLLAALHADPTAGLAGPSTNLAWNEQGLRGAPPFRAGIVQIEAYAAQIAATWGGQVATLAPLYSLSDFCVAVRREVIAAIGAADEGYGSGPCWEMDYNIRAARAGFRGLWVRGAYVHRAPYTARRTQDERRLFTASKQRYQDKFCALRLRGEKSGYEAHCRGDACEHFAPPGLIRLLDPALQPALRLASAQGDKIRPSSATHAPELQPSTTTATAVARQPLVSCIMPTSNRRAFMSQAVRCFLNQDYPHLELLILDDGSDPIRDCLPEDPRVRYVHLDQKLILGAKRNLAVAQARGEIIAHWDDDDWYPRSRIRVQVQALLERGADLCGSSQLYFYEASSDRAWRYAYTDPTARWVAGSTMVYRKDFWARNRFPEIAIGEDTRFVWSQAAKTVADLADPSLCIASIHAGNSSPRVTRGHYWLPQPAEVVHALLDAEQARAVPPLPAPAVESAPQAWPLISCIMPTANRRPFVTLALDGFARQDYPNKELVIVDDGLDPVDDLTAGLADVRYVRLAVPASIGAKRNRACAEAQGEIIAHWDDDDWYAPSRLHYQAAPILAGDADITGLENSYLLALPDGQFWTTQPQLHRRMFVGDVHGGTLMYRKAILGGRVQYPAVNLAEDAMLLQQALRGGRRLLRLANDGVFVYVRHGSNAWQFETGRFLDPAGWQRIAAPVTFDAGLLARYQDALRDPAAASPRVPYQ